MVVSPPRPPHPTRKASSSLAPLTDKCVQTDLVPSRSAPDLTSGLLLIYAGVASLRRSNRRRRRSVIRFGGRRGQRAPKLAQLELVRDDGTSAWLHKLSRINNSFQQLVTCCDCVELWRGEGWLCGGAQTQISLHYYFFFLNREQVTIWQNIWTRC